MQSDEVLSKVTSIGDYAFQGCNSLWDITLPEAATSIGQYAFSSCTSLRSINIPESVMSIGNGAFSACNSLTSITIPESVTSIGEEAFFYCRSLTSITIPQSVTSIGNDAFSYCLGLTSIAIPLSVKSIGNGAFSYCSGLISITIPQSVTSIGDGAFSYCYSLASITIPDLATIGEGLFNGCTALRNVSLPVNITSTLNFSDSPNLELIEVKAIIPPPVTSTTFNVGVFGKATLCVPESSVHFYKQTPIWNYFYNIVGKDFTTSLKSATVGSSDYTVSYTGGEVWVNVPERAIGKGAVLYSASGSPVRGIDIASGKTRISTDGLAPGMYILRMSDGTALRIMR